MADGRDGTGHRRVARCGAGSGAGRRRGVGGFRSADAARLSALRDALAPGTPLRCVVEVGDVDATVAAITQLDRAAGGLELVELKCRSVEDAAAVRRRVDVPIAVDAALLTGAGQPADVADIAVLRCGPLGGVRRALRRAEAIGLPVVVNIAGLTSIGQAGDVALAAALPDLPFACGPATRSLVDADVVSDARSLVVADGYLPAAPMPAAPDAGRLARFAVTDPATIARWRELLHRAAALL